MSNNTGKLFLGVSSFCLLLSSYASIAMPMELETQYGVISWLVAMVFLLGGVSLWLGWMLYRLQNKQQNVDHLQRSQAILNAVGESVLLLNSQGKVIFANPTALAMLQCPFEHVVGRPQTDFFRHTIKLSSNSGPSQLTQETELRCCENVHIPVAYFANPLYEKDVLLGIVVSFRDIRDQRQAEQQLRESEAHYRELFIGNQAVSLLVEPISGKIIDANDAASEFYGYSIAQLQHLKITDINIGSETQIQEELLHTQASKRNHFFFLHRLANDEVRAVEVHSGPVSIQGRKLLYSIVHDITERRRAEQALRDNEARLKAIFNNAAVGIVVFNHQKCITQCNAKFEAMLGYPANALYGATHEQVLYAEDAVSCHSIFQQLLDGRLAYVQEEKRFMRRDGSMFYANLWVTPLQDDEFKGVLSIVIDVTQHHQIESAQQALQLRYATLAEASPVGLFETDAIGLCLYINDQAARILQRPEEEITSLLWTQFIHPNDRELVTRQWHNSLQGQTPLQMEFRLQTRDSQALWVIGQVVAAFDTEGTLTGFIGTLTDITERKRMEEQLRENAEHLRALINATPDLILFKDGQGNWIDANKALLNLLQLDSINFKYKQNHELAQLVPSQYRTILLNFERADSKVWETGATTRCEQVIPDSQGNTRVFDMIKVPIFHPSGQRKGLVLLGRDISQHKSVEVQLRQAEAKYHTLVEQMPAVIYITDLQGNVSYVNPYVHDLLGYSPQDWMQQNDNWQLVHQDDRERARTAYQTALDKGTDFSSEYRIISRQKNIVWVYDQALIVWNGNQPAYIQGVMLDISKRKEAEEALWQANEQLKLRVAELARRSEEINLLSDMGNLLQTCLNAEEAYQVITRFMQRLFPKTTGMLATLDAGSNQLSVVATWNGGDTHSQERFTTNDCWALRLSRIYHVSTPHSQLICSHVNALLPSRYLCVPMLAQGELFGLLHVAQIDTDEVQQDFNDAQHYLAETLAEHAALALSNLRLRETLHNQSIRDPLTGLFNRRYLEETLEREFHQAQRQQHTIGIIMLDLDHFKRFNDTYGHDAGDLVLQHLGTFLQNAVRKSDIACRYGGEEFTLIMPNAALEEVQQRAETLRSGIKQLTVQYQQKVLKGLTLSLGVGMFPQHGGTPRSVLRAADVALYQAKTHGRDKVVIAGG